MYLRVHRTGVKSVPVPVVPNQRIFAFWTRLSSYLPVGYLRVRHTTLLEGKYVSMLTADDTSKLLCWYKLPMHGGQDRHLLDVKNDNRKLFLSKTYWNGMYDPLQRTSFHPSRTISIGQGGVIIERGGMT
jgi:hypothetical protein